MKGARRASAAVSTDQLEVYLSTSVPKIVKKAMENTFMDIAREIRGEVKKSAPAENKRYLRRHVRARKGPPTRRRGVRGAEVVFAEPAYYWRMVEYGHGQGKGSHRRKRYQPFARPFIGPIRERYQDNIAQMIEDKYMPNLNKALEREARRLERKASRGR